MKIGVRTRLFGLLLMFITSIVLVSGAYLEHALRARLERNLERELVRHATSIKEVINLVLKDDSISAVDQLADRMGESLDMRVTIITLDGVVLGDSELTKKQVRNIDNHGNRPEIREAIAHGIGTSKRFSTTLSTDMFYLALGCRVTKNEGIIRIAIPLSDVDQAVDELRLILLITGLITLVISVLISGIASYLISKSLRKLLQHARTITAGSNAQQSSVLANEDIGGIEDPFSRFILELNQTVDALASERDRLETIVQSMREAVLALDERQRITLANRAALRLFSIKKRYENRSLLEVIRIPAITELVQECTEKGTANVELELPIRPPRRVLAVAASLRSSRGIVIVMHDVTEMRRLETIRRDFVANVSHELRTPVSVIQANAETLLNGAFKEQKTAFNFLEAIHRNAARLSNILSDLLELSRIEAGQYRFDLKNIQLIDSVRRSLEYVETRAKERAISLKCRVASSLMVKADVKALDVILINLLDNAVKYTHEGGLVEIESCIKDDMVQVEVSDNGPGIEPKHRDRVFERFYRVDAGRSREVGGTGLGLAIVKHLVTSMGGSIGVEPVSPCGSRFWLTLPESRSVN